MTGGPGGDQQRTDLASERTTLAAERTGLALERTVLAWWRTALASLAVALAVGRLLPELTDASPTWPHVTLGVAFAAYACGLFAYGAVRSRALPSRATGPMRLAAVVGSLLALATLVIVLVG